MVTRKRSTRGSRQRNDGFYDALGRTIKVARTDLGIERKDLAEHAGISYSYLAAIENGQKQPSSQVLLDLAEALGLRTHELLESAEGRRDRNLSTTEEFPHWLTGRQRSNAMGIEGSPLYAGADPIELASPAKPSDAGDGTDFLEQIERLTKRVSESDRRLLLEMATKLADRRS